jgi:hypothetical protein
VIGLLTFQNMGKAAAQALRANAIVTADRGGFDVTVEVLNGRLTACCCPTANLATTYNQPRALHTAKTDRTSLEGPNKFPPVLAGQSVTCRFSASLNPGNQYTYVVYAVDGSSGKAVQIAKGVVTVGIA